MVSPLRSLFVAVATLVSTSAFANPFTVAVGETKVITLSRRTSGARVENGAVVEVTRMPKGTAVVVTGREMGKTDLVLRTSDGATVTLTVNVTSGGSRTFSVDRRATRMTLSTPEVEPESASLPPPTSEAVGEDGAVAAVH